MTLRNRFPAFSSQLSARPEYLWLALALPAAFMVAPVIAGTEAWRHAIRPTGEFGAVLLALALSIAPLRAAFPGSTIVFWLLRRRRHIGVAAFLYAALHMVVFALSIGRVDHILQGMAFASMWTGWIAFAMLLAVASISSNAAMRSLGRWWKRIQRLAYPAAILTLAHWLLLTRTAAEALVWFAPLAVLEAYRLWTVFRSKA